MAGGIFELSSQRLFPILQTVLEGLLFRFEMLRILFFGLIPLHATYLSETLISFFSHLFRFLGFVTYGAYTSFHVFPTLCGGYCMDVYLLKTYYSCTIALWLIDVLYAKIACLFFYCLFEVEAWCTVCGFFAVLFRTFNVVMNMWSFVSHFFQTYFSYGWLWRYICGISFGMLVIYGFYRNKSSLFTITCPQHLEPEE